MRQAQKDWRERRRVKAVLGFLDRHGYIATGVVFLALFGFQILQNAQTADQTNDAVCSFRSDLERRVALSTEFLKSNPEGIQGIPADIIRQQIENQRMTIDSLGDLECN